MTNESNPSVLDAPAIATAAAAPVTPAAPAAVGVGRRGFLQRLGLAGAAAATAVPLGATLLSGGAPAIARAQTARGFTAGDVAILRWLNLAEFVGGDLYSQISELANNNPGFNAACVAIDPNLPYFIAQSARDEISHAVWLRAFLLSRGLPEVLVDEFRTLPSSLATGATQVARLTNLTGLTVDTSYYNRLRQDFNPDLAGEAPQVATIISQPAIPLDDNQDALRLQIAASTAAFYIGFQGQGEVGNYGSFEGKATNPQLNDIISAIRPVEGVHLDFANAALANLPGLNAGPNAIFPDLRNDPLYAFAFSPAPTHFLDLNLPLISVARPGTTAVIGAVQIVQRLTAAGLFNGQSATFMSASMEIAQAADAAFRNG